MTQEQIDRMEEAVVSPEREVQDGRRRVQRRSVEEAIQALQFSEGRRAAADGKRRVKQVRMVLSPG